jgi:Zn-dependent protease
MSPEHIATGAVWYIVFLLSLTCHEASHALVAKWGGDPTAFHSGQVTLNPLPHMRREPFGTIIVPLLSYALGGWMIGWGSAPYDPAWQFRYPRRAAWMALAGPLANVALLLLAVVGIHVGIIAGVLVAPGSAGFSHVVTAISQGYPEGLALFLSVLFSLNLLLAAFNLLPVPPLDGNTAAGLVLSEDAARRFAALSHNRTFSLIGLLLCWKLFGYIFSPIFTFGLNLLYPGSGYH